MYDGRLFQAAGPAKASVASPSPARLLVAETAGRPKSYASANVGCGGDAVS